MEASLVQTLAPQWLCPCAQTWSQGHHSCQSDVQHKCHTNHHLVRCKLRLHFKPKPRKGGPCKKKFNLNKLQSAEVKADFQAGLQSKLENNNCPEDTSPEKLWDQLKSAILQTYEEVLGFTIKKDKDRFDEINIEIQDLLAKKRSRHQAHLAQLSCPVRRAAWIWFSLSVLYSWPCAKTKLNLVNQNVTMT